jgi:hypothetical protein
MGERENSEPEQTEQRQSATNRCPVCRGKIDSEAVLCRHCGSNIKDASQGLPQHGGVCPFCRETIHEQATICRHCGSHLVGESAGPSHGGLCPFCREGIDPQAIVCPKCRSTLWQRPGNSLVRVINDGGGGGSSGDCTWDCYDLCRDKTDNSPRECLRKCRGICRPGSGGVIARGVAEMDASALSTGCGCSSGNQPTVWLAGGTGGGGGAGLEKCHYEDGFVCDMNGCRTIKVLVCIKTPGFGSQQPLA